MSSTSAPSSFNIETYFKRIGFAFSAGETVKPDLKTLTQITRHHSASIPFENTDAFLDVPVSTELEKLYDKMILSQRGGYCFEQNTLICSAFQSLGFDSFVLLGRVYFPYPDKVPTRTHCAVHVRFEDGSAYLVDVGYGGGTMTTPLQLRRAGSTSTDPYVDMCGVEQFTDNGKYIICREGLERTESTSNSYGPPALLHPKGHAYTPPQCLHTDPALEGLYQTYGVYLWQHLTQRWRLMYTFDLQRQAAGDIQVMNYYAATASSFKTMLMMYRIVERPKEAANAHEGENNSISTGSGGGSNVTSTGAIDAVEEVTLMNNHFARYKPGMTEQLEKRTLTSAEELYDILKIEFNLNVDDPKHGISLEKLREKTHHLFESDNK